MNDDATSDQTIRIIAWRSAPVPRPTHDARSSYVERCWLPILGPSTLLFLRFAVDALEREPDGAVVPIAEIAGALGLRGRTGDVAPFRRTLERAVDFHMVRRLHSGTLAVRRHLPELSPRQLERAPRRSSAAPHDELRLGSANRQSPTSAHALRLAKALAALGETPAEIELQLRKWRFEPATAYRSAERADPFGSPPLVDPASVAPVRSGGPLPIRAALSDWESH